MVISIDFIYGKLAKLGKNRVADAEKRYHHSGGE
jgi:hypothetical protein